MTSSRFSIPIRDIMATKKTSGRQFEIMLNYFDKNTHLLTGRSENKFTKEEIRQQWKELVYLLNSAGDGPKKNEEKWKKTLKDWKGYVRGKARRIASHYSATGGNPPCRDTLSKLDQKLLTLLARKDNEEDESIDLTFQDELAGGSDSLGEKIGDYLSIEMTDMDADNHYVSNESYVTASLNHFKSVQEESHMKKESGLADIASKIIELQTEILNSQRKILLVEERKAEAAVRKAVALERIAAAKEREAIAVEGMYLLKKQKLEELSPQCKKIKLDEIVS